MNFIEALKSGKKFRHKSWTKNVWCVSRTGNSFSLYRKFNSCEELYILDYYIAVNDMLDETGWEVYKEQRKVELSFYELLWNHRNIKIPDNAKVTIEWEE